MTSSNKAATENALKAMEASQQNIAEATKAFNDFFTAMANCSRKALEGALEIDKAIIDQASQAASNQVQFGCASLNAKSPVELYEMQASYAHDLIEQTAANNREILDMAQATAREAYGPFMEVFSSKMSDDD